MARVARQLQVRWAPVLTQKSFRARDDINLGNQPPASSTRASVESDGFSSSSGSAAVSSSSRESSVDDFESNPSINNVEPIDQSAMYSSMRVKGFPVSVKVGVEPNATVFYVHEDLLCSSSEFFQAALRGRWRESTERLVCLPSHTAQSFAMYYNFLYDKEIVFDPNGDEDSKAAQDWMSLAMAWMLGDRLQDTAFKDAVIDTIMAKSRVDRDMNRYFPIHLVPTYIYDNTPSSSALRRLIVDQHTYYGTPSWLQDMDVADLNKEFLLDLAISLLKNRRLVADLLPPGLRDLCHYHEHSHRETCYNFKP